MAEKARDEKTAAVDNLKARIESGDLTIAKREVREAFEEAEYADLRLAGANANLTKAVERDTRDKAIRLYEESRPVYEADLAELAKAIAPLPRVIAHVLEVAARTKAHDRDFKSRALALLPADVLNTDPQLRDLPPELAQHFAFGEYNPGLGASAIARLDPVPALLALCVESLLTAPPEFLQPDSLAKRLRFSILTTEDKRELDRIRGYVTLPRSNGLSPEADPPPERTSGPETISADAGPEPAVAAAMASQSRRPQFTPERVEPHPGPLSAVEIDPGPYDPYGIPD
jgi:hypothetical protein